MAVVPVAFRAETADEIEIAFTAALLPLTTARIFGVEFGQIQSQLFSALNLFGAFSYNTTGATALGAPFIARTFSHANEAQVILLVKAFIAANPTYFFSEIFLSYRPQSPNPDQGVIALIFYNTVGTAAGANWGGSAGGVPIGPVGGDLSGSLPNPTVVGIQTVPVVPGPFIAGGQLTYDVTTNRWVSYVVRVYTTLANAAADQANQIIGQNIIIFNSPATPQDGTYQLTAKTGSPANYTLISTATNLASEIALDAPIPPLVATNVYTALQEIVMPSATGTAGAGVSTLHTVPLATTARVDWYVVLQRGTARYIETLHYTHDGVNPFGTSDEIAATTFAFNATLAVTVVGANLVLSINNTGAACDYRVKAVTLPV